MAQPSKAGPVILTLFALPFLGGGLFFFYAQLVSRRNFPDSSLIVGLAMASFFIFVGGGLIVASIKGYGLLKQQAALQDANPSSPWLWRSDWALRRAQSQSQKTYIGAWILAALGNLFLFPFVFGMFPQLLRRNDPRVISLLLLAAFSSLGAFLVVRAIRATIRHERFGDSYFEFDSLPFSLGERVTGRIHLRFETQAAHGIDLRLSCVRRVVTSAGENSSTTNITLWQADKNIPSGAVAPGPLGRAIPVDFELPPDGLQTDHSNSHDQVLWLLHAQADVPGVDYTDDFELPIFRTASSPQPSRDPTSQNASPAPSGAGRLFGVASVPSIDGDSGAVPQPARTKVVVSMHDGGTEFYFPPFRTPLRAMFLLIFLVIFSGAVYLLFHSRVPFFFTAIFGLFDLFAIFGFLHMAFGSRSIFVGNGEIRSRGGLFGLGAQRRTPFSEIAAIVPAASLQQGGNSDNAVYLIRMFLKARKPLTLADEVASRQEARWVVSQIETLAGLKLDTHVEVDLPLGVQAQPPQFASGSVQGTNPQTPAFVLAAFLLFAVLFGGLFAWRANHMFTNAARRSRAVAAPRPLPAQAQAEELLERALKHDMRALEAINQQVAGWPGQLQHSPRLDQLVQRSQFSKDLRVRLANIDVNLALEGFHENEDAVSSLIARADSDPQHRAWALYYLGMLAGRGVAYDRIHPILLGYARNDPDAAVRQWAVEGLRFLGKDEALDELYASFTEDPSMQVRDRAGCNISDCGIFTRKQRMRMVPQLIDLAANPNTTPRIRNWCFMALQEITDENQPADAIAWRRWYAEHGAEKMAAFERLEWWQVRGDE